jgi:hypothetical protein
MLQSGAFKCIKTDKLLKDAKSLQAVLKKGKK